MQRFILFFLFLNSGTLVSAQTLNIYAGTTLSKIMFQPEGFDTSTDTRAGLAVFAGISFLDRKFYNLCTQIGYISKGGNETLQVSDFQVAGNVLREPVLDYLSFNTQFEAKLRIKTISPFIAAGPRVDYLVHTDGVKSTAWLIGEMQDISAGMLYSAGLKYKLPQLQLIVRSDYYHNFTSIVKNREERLFDRTITVLIGVGYKLSRG